MWYQNIWEFRTTEQTFFKKTLLLFSGRTEVEEQLCSVLGWWRGGSIPGLTAGWGPRVAASRRPRPHLHAKLWQPHPTSTQGQRAQLPQSDSSWCHLQTTRIKWKQSMTTMYYCSHESYEVTGFRLKTARPHTSVD